MKPCKILFYLLTWDLKNAWVGNLLLKHFLVLHLLDNLPGTVEDGGGILEFNGWQKKGNPRRGFPSCTSCNSPILRIGKEKESFALCGEQPKAPPLESATLWKGWTETLLFGAEFNGWQKNGQENLPEDLYIFKTDYSFIPLFLLHCLKFFIYNTINRKGGNYEKNKN